MSTNSSAASPVNALIVTAGVPFDLTVTACDPYNNVVTNYAGTIHFTSSDASAQLPADYSFKPTDKGVHVFKVLLNTKGQQSLNLSDSGSLTLDWVVTVL